MSPFTWMGMPRALATGVAVSMHLRIGLTIRLLIACSGLTFPHASLNSSARNLPSASACLKPFSVRDGSDDLPGLCSEGVSEARVGNERHEGIFLLHFFPGES